MMHRMNRNEWLVVRGQLACLICFVILSQRLIADDAPVINPFAMQACISAQVTNALQEVKAIWEEPSDAYISQANRILNLKPNDPQALRMFFTGISDIPLPLAGTDFKEMRTQAMIKWKTLYDLAFWNPSLGKEPETWESLATMVGWVRQQIVPDFTPSGGMMYSMILRETEQERRTRQEEEGRKLAMSSFQRSLRDIVKRWAFIHDDIRHLAAKMPPDERKQFLNKIKELARSDEEEAKRLDEPVVSEKVKYPSVEVMRNFLSRLPPDRRKQRLEEIRQESDYTEEQLKELDAPYE